MIMESDSSVTGSVTICQQCFEPLYIYICIDINSGLILQILIYVCLDYLYTFVEFIINLVCYMFCLQFCVVLGSDFIEHGN
jgi:hypothetical protein